MYDKENRKIWIRKYRKINRDKLNAKERERYERNRDKFLKKGKNWRERNKDKLRSYYLNNREKILANSKERNKNYRLKVIEYYSNGKNMCACCKENTYEFLSVDHINGGGGKHRRFIKGKAFTMWLIKQNYPKGYQILCHNCNQAKGLYGKCPHEK